MTDGETVKRKWGAIPDKEDGRDKLFAARRPKKGFFKQLLTSVVPEKVDLRPFCGPVKNQKDLGACTGFTFAGFRELLLRKQFENEPSADYISNDEILSPLYVYYKEREEEGTIGADEGASLRTGCKVLTKYGVCPEREYPYAPKDYQKKPDISDDNDAQHFRTATYHRLRTLEDMKVCLLHGYPVAIGFRIYPSFDVDERGVMTLPSPTEVDEGGHAVLVVGFDDSRNVLIVRNSWGDDWGDNGNFYMPYGFVTPKNIFDAWTISVDPETFI
jgi:C1A family cysteine protease